MQVASFRRFWVFPCCAALLLYAAGCARSGLLVPELHHSCLGVAPDAPSAQQVSAEVLLDHTDILFLVDNSASMAAEIRNIRDQLVGVLVPEINARVHDGRLGVAVFSDFGERRLGAPSHPYRLLQPITDDVGAVLQATESIHLEEGGDRVESQLEALYQVATGEGLGIYVDKGPDCGDDGRGGVCFRRGSFALAMLFTDAPMRNVTGIGSDGRLSPPPAPDPSDNLAPFIPVLREYDETVEALQAESIRVVGLWSGTGDGIDDLRRVAQDTGTLDASGQPIVLDIGTEGEGLGEGVVNSLELATQGARLDVSLELEDGDAEDGIDPRALVTEVIAARAEPADGAQIDADRFLQVRSGTSVFFDVWFDPSRVPQAAREQRYPLVLRVRASDGTLLTEQTVDLVISADACLAAAENEEAPIP